MRKFLTLTIAFVVLSAFSVTGQAWWSVGHMVVANIAYQNLKPDVKIKVDNLVAHFKKEYHEIKTFEQMSVWLDTVHLTQQDYLYYHWHYIDKPFYADETRTRIYIPTDNIAWAIKKIERCIGQPNINAFEQARLLAFLTHLVGDVHQPLHTVARVSATQPKGDKGGNVYFVYDHGSKISLHKIWDSGFGLFVKTPGLNGVKQIAQRLMTAYPPVYFGEKIKHLNINDWLQEGMNNAVQYVYTIPEKQEMSAHYQIVGKKLVEEEVALAGYRLASLINELLSA